MIPKPGATDATELRPIGLMPVVYRLWAAARQPYVRQWLRPLENLVLGGRPGVGAELASLEAGAIAAEALASGEHAAAAFLDVSKAYEGVDHALLADAALAEGFPPRIAHLAIAAYRGPRRVVLSGTPASRCAFPHSGIIAGCPVAVALMGLYLLRPLRGLGDLGLSLVRGFVDDLALLATGPQDEVGLRLIAGVDLLIRLIRPLGLEPNAAKHQVVASSEAARTQLADRFGIQVGTGAVDLGADFCVGPTSRAKQELRLQDASGRAQRVGALPLSRPQRVQFVRAEVLAVGLYGASTAGLSVRTLHRLRALCSRALLGTKRERRSCMARTVLLSALGNLDPWVLGPLQVLKTWSRFFLYSSAPLTHAWARSLRSRGHSGLLTDHLYQALLRAGFCPGRDPRVWVSALGHEYEPTQLAWVPEASASLHATAWAHMAARRREFSDSLPPPTVFGPLRRAAREGRREEAGLRLLCLSGGSWAPTRAARAGILLSSRCPHCGADHADACHRFWACPRWQDLRVQLGVLDIASQACRAAFEPRQLWECGLPVLSTGPSEPSVAAVHDGHLAGRLFFTDGSVLRSSDPDVSRAGWAFTDGANCAGFGSLPGFSQTITRAELWAVLACASAHDEQLTVCTDSQYVVQGAAAVLRDLAPLSHGDLWERFRALHFPPWLIKVPAHLDASQAALRGLPEAIRCGNEAADALARRGASLFSPSGDVLNARASALELCLRVQDAQWRILRAVLNVERRPLGALRRFVRIRRGAHPPGPTRPRITHGAHQVVPSGTHFQCLLCQRLSRTAAPRAWRYRPCLPRARREPHEASASHLIWESHDRIGCHLCGRTSGKRWKSRLLSSVCFPHGPRALPAFHEALRPLPCEVRLFSEAAFPVPLGTGGSVVLDGSSLPAPWASAHSGCRSLPLPPDASASHCLWERDGFVGCLGCRRRVRRRDKHRLLGSACRATRLAFWGLHPGSSEPVDVTEDDVAISSVELSGLRQPLACAPYHEP
ncbi:MAG: hypothetical protein GY772_22755, partial [bacterium]|nr:hypothetical protein [bacterium]